MQYALRPYATAGVALVGASIIAVTPVVVPLPEVQTRSVQLVDAWADLVTDTTANLTSIANNADIAGITSVFNALATNPIGVFQALTDLTPTVSADLGSLPGSVSVELPPGLALLFAQISAEGAGIGAINDVIGQLASNPAGAFNTLLEAPAVIANAFLNGDGDINLLNGLVNITGFSGLLAPLGDVGINLNLSGLLDALGVGGLNLNVLGVDLSDLLSQLGLGDNLDLGGLIDALGLNDGVGLGTLLGNPTLGDLLGAFGLGGLGLGSFDLTSVLSGLGLDGNVDLNNLGLDGVLAAFGLDAPINTPLIDLLESLNLGSFLDQGLGSTLPAGLLSGVLAPLNSVLGDLLGNLQIPLVGSLGGVLNSLFGISVDNLLDPGDLIAALNQVTIGQLLEGPTITESVSGLLTALGVDLPNNLSIGDILTGLGFSPDTGLLTLDDLLGGFNLDNIDLTGFLNGLSLNLGDLLDGLNLSGLGLDLTQLGDLSNLTLDGLLGALGLGDLAQITIDPFGGLITQLAETIPQQILTALGG